MPIPFNYNPVAVEIDVLRTGDDYFEDRQTGFRSPTVRRYDRVSTLAQPNFQKRRWAEVRAAYGGNMDDSTGSLIFKQSQLDLDGYAPKPGDVVVSVAGVATEFVITEVRRQSPGPPLLTGATSARHEIVYAEVDERDRARRQGEQT